MHKFDAIWETFSSGHPLWEKDSLSCIQGYSCVLSSPTFLPSFLPSRPSWDCRRLCRNICALCGALRWSCQQQSFILGRNCVLALVLPPFLRPPTSSTLLLSIRPILLHHLSAPKKGYDIILEWALRYIALFLSLRRSTTAIRKCSRWWLRYHICVNMDSRYFTSVIHIIPLVNVKSWGSKQFRGPCQLELVTPSTWDIFFLFFQGSDNVRCPRPLGGGEMSVGLLLQ